MTDGRRAALVALALTWALLLWALLVWALFVWAIGPVGLLAVVVLVVPRVGPWLRNRLRPRGRPSWRWLVSVLVVVAVAVAGMLLVPPGRLPLPPGAGTLVTPSYVGRAASPEPLPLGGEVVPGPVGDSPQVASGWYGGEDCGDLVFLGSGTPEEGDEPARLVAICSDGVDRELRIVDPTSLRPLASRELAAPTPALADRPGCARAFAPVDGDRVVVATADRSLDVIATRDAAGEPDPTLVASTDLSGSVADDDCLVSVGRSEGRLWWASADGVVGTVEPGGEVRALTLAGEVANAITVAEGVVYVVTTEALVAVGLDAAGRPEVRWSAVYDVGSAVREGQLSRGAGGSPVVLPGAGVSGPLVVITDNAEPRVHVRFHRAGDGALVCQEPVFTDDDSAVESTPVVVDDAGVVVQNSAGWTGPSRTLLGRAPAGGMTRVDVEGTGCTTTWTADVVSPSARAVVSPLTGLVYAWTTRHSWWGVSAWSLTGIEARTGRVRFAARAGLGAAWSPRRGGLTLGPDAAAYVSTVGGLARLRDRIPTD